MRNQSFIDLLFDFLAALSDVIALVIFRSARLHKEVIMRRFIESFYAVLRAIAETIASLVGCLIPFLIMGLMLYVGGLVFWWLVGLIASLFE